MKIKKIHLANQIEIQNYLKTKSKDLSFVNKLKVVYRPLICPMATLLNYVENGDSAFDIGCGSGQFCALIAKFTSAEKIFGIEISKTLVSNAQVVNEEFKGLKQINFEIFDGKEIPNTINQYSKIFLIDVLHHVPKNEQVDFLREIYLRMSVGSKLILKDINASNVLVYFNKLHDIVFSKEIGNELKLESTRKMAEDTGFKIIDCFTERMFLYPHYFLILEK